ncbi:MAG: PIN domain-containing protein [Candidatus Micrarchaeota archaeon]
MNIIMDSNVLFSALIKKSATRRIILEFDGEFLFPSFIFEEMKKHEEELVMKSHMKEKDFDKLLGLILKKVIIVPKEAFLKHRKKALDIVGKIDPDDAVFIACALEYQDCIIWSDDKKLKKITQIKVLNTKEIIQILDN